MKKRIFSFCKLCIGLSVILSFSSCEIFDFHPYDGRLNADIRTDVNNIYIKQIEHNCKNKDTIRFIFLGDTQACIDETKDFVKHVNTLDSIDFIIHGGDITEFGLTKEYEWAYYALNKLKYPYVAIIGNHDAVGTGLYVYKNIYGDDNFSFIAGNTKFVCLNTNALEYDYSKPIPDFEFIRQEIHDTSTYSNTVVVMHANPGCEQFNNNVMWVFQEYIKHFPSLQFCLHAHHHAYMQNDIFDDGTIYYGCESIRKRSYLLFTLTEGGYTHEKVNF